LERLEEEVATLQEYKTKLIADVVTGKIDVRNIEISDYEFVNEENKSSSEDREEFDGEINEE